MTETILVVRKENDLCVYNFYIAFDLFHLKLLYSFAPHDNENCSSKTTYRLTEIHHKCTPTAIYWAKRHNVWALSIISVFITQVLETRPVFLLRRRRWPVIEIISFKRTCKVGFCSPFSNWRRKQNQFSKLFMYKTQDNGQCHTR